ncbi:MAG: aminoglycoside phosphotransferase family protein, partial [Moorea sp. SIO4A5]|nr:aminoglycoside phosphotransferase family protein [Moorena sp. SIO4A5]
MAFLLSSKNVFEYLIEQGICTEQEQALGKIEPKAAKNFNLLLTLPEGRKLLVKQEPYDQDGETVGEFLKEWRSQEFLRQFPEVSHLGSWLPEVLHFDPDNSII